MTPSLAKHAPKRIIRLRALLTLLPLLAPLAAVPLLGGCAGGGSPARSASAAAAPLPPIEYAGQWGSRGSNPGDLDDPVGPAVDAAGRVYFADRGTGAVAKFEAGGVPLLAFEDAVVRNASAIAVDHGGGIYVADLDSGRLQIFWPQGDPLSAFRLAPQRGFAGPFAFTVDARGTIFVPNPASGQILSFDRHGRLLGAWKMPSSAAGAAHPSLAVAAPDGGVFVADARSGAIAKFASDGQLLATFGAPAPLMSMAASPQFLFVLRDRSPRLDVWTLDGHLKLQDDLGGRLDGKAVGSAARETVASAAGAGTTVGETAGTPAASAASPRASLAVTPQGDLLVLDPSGPRILRFRIHLDAP